MESESSERIVALSEREIDWEYLIRIALQHGVIPLLYRSLSTVRPEAVPKIILEKLRYHFHANATRNLLLTKELLNLLDLLEAHQIAAIPYKGPVLALSVYGNLALREFADLDILVREEDYRMAQKRLIDEGYRLVKEFYSESTLVHTSGGFAVDLHKEMTGRNLSCPLNFQYLSRRLEHITVAGTEIPTLSREDTLVMLAIQITKDVGGRYFQLAKICDLAELLRVQSDLDFEDILRQARRLGGQRMLLYSLQLSNSLLGARLPEKIVRELRLQPAIDGLVKYARRQLFDKDDHTVGDQRSIEWFRWLVRERLRDKLYPYYLRYVTDVLVPCELDRLLLALPAQLSFLYYFIRPVRLTGKYARLQVRRLMRRPQ
jgi:hypothetical protein